MFNWLQRFNRSKRSPLPIILVGIGYASHKLSQRLQDTDDFKLVACIDDEPWSHRTLFQGARVHYPGELIALTDKHEVEVVVDYSNEPPMLEPALVAELETHTVQYLVFDSVTDSVESQIDKLLAIRALH